MSRKKSRHSIEPISNRRKANRGRKQLAIEAVESRLLLTSVPQLIQINPTGDSAPSNFTQVGDIVYFVANDGTTGRELWKTDGTQAGTSLVTDIRPGATGSSPRDLFVFGGQLYFAANNGTHGEELWKSDGTAAGTVMVRDINPGSGYQAPYGSGPLGSFPRDMTNLNGKLFFSSEDATGGGELWTTNGTESGTVRVLDLWPGTGQNTTYGTYAYSSNPQNFQVFNGNIYFTADNGETGRELWKTDGTSAGTVLVKDIYPGTYTEDGYGPYPFSSVPTQLTVVGNQLMFVALTGTNGAELWKSDGTADGTVLVRDINPGTASSMTGEDSLVAVNGVLYFTAKNNTAGIELWRSDGTDAGTTMIRDVNPGVADGLKDAVLVNMNGTLVFAANDGSNGTELWRSNGTADGTFIIQNIASSTASSSPKDLAVVGDRVFFSAETANDGRELWESDGILSVMVADLASGTASSNPTAITAVGNKIYFAANNGTAGNELYTLDANETATVSLTIYVNGQRVPIPVNVGADSTGNPTSMVRTTDANGTLVFDPLPGIPLSEVTLDVFFNTWQTAAGAAGNNANATFSPTELMNNDANAANTVQMFVNGELNTSFQNFSVTSGDRIVLVYGSNPVVSINTNYGPIVMELFESQKPITVNNFLTYINDGDYVNSIFHRSDPDFVIQGGGFRTSSPTYTSTAQFTSVPTDPQIQNEPGISNLRGTVAMAKLGGNPNSATSQFFVNLSNDNAFLDLSSNNSFTVFAQVLDMATVDRIEDLPLVDAGTVPYRELPVGPNNQLVVVQSIEGYGEITGTKFRDLDRDGVRDSGEPAVAGVRVYVDANTNGVFDAGESFAITDSQGAYRLQADPGSRVIRAESSANSTTTTPTNGRHELTITTGRVTSNINFAEAPIPIVGTIDLLAATDTGTSNTDNITTRNNSAAGQTLQFTISGVVSGAEVRLKNGTAVIGTAVATGTTVTLTTNGTVTLPDGVHALRATQVINGGESDPSEPLSITVDTSMPAAITNVPTTAARVGQAYSFDLASTDEGQTGFTYSLVNAPAGMTINSANGQGSWTPTAAQAVPQSFQVAIADLAGNTRTADVQLTVLGELPAQADTYTTNEDTVLTVAVANGVLTNDGTQSSGTLTATVVVQPTNGTLTLNANGSFTYTPAANFSGTDTFTYRASNGTITSNVAQVTITVSAVNDAPVGVADTYTVNEDGTLTVNVATGVLANDTDVEVGTLTATVVTQPTRGNLTLNANGSFTYTPTANFNGTDTFTYRASDGTANSNPVTVTITVNGTNDAPTAVSDTYTVNEDGTLSVVVANGVLANDTDPETTLTASVATSPANGTVTMNTDGSFSYTPNANFNGTDTFTYLARDASGVTATGTVTITVTSQPDAPAANNDTVSITNSGTAETVNVLTNDSSAPDGTQTLTITAVTQGTAGGTVTLTGNTITYRPATGFTGTDTFTYTLRDTDNLTDTATVTVNVTAGATASLSGFVYLDTDNDGVRDTGEVGVPGSQITLTRTGTATPLTRTLITNNLGAYVFSDLPAGTYQLTQTQPAALVDGTDTTSATGTTNTNDQFANIVLTAGQTIANNNFGERSILPAYISVVWFFASAGSTESVFREMVAVGEDKAGKPELATAIRNGSTDGVNRAPVANANTYTTNAGTVLTVNTQNGVLANDTDADSDPLTATLVDGPDHGTLTLNADGSFVFTPTAGFSGTDTFTYTATDGRATSSAATVTIAISSVQNTFSVAENSPAGTVVGTVVSNTVNSNTPLYQFVDSSVRSELRLLPDDHIEGDPAAPLVLIEYLDLQCPICQQFHPIVEDLQETFGDDLLVVRRHLPLTTIHPNAFVAARHAEAAGRQGKFEEMADLMYTNQDAWENSSTPQTFFNTYAQQLGLNMTQFATDVADTSIDTRINRDVTTATALGANATPTFYLNGRVLNNTEALDDFEEILDDELDDFDDPFIINRNTGRITVSGASVLNFEAQPTITRQVVVRNLNGTTDTVTVTINLTNVNESTPVAVANTYSVTQGTVLTVTAANGVITNDTDADGDTLTATLVSTTTNGTLTLNPNGSFTYTPNATFQGTDTFTYRATDGQFTSATPATVTITVLAQQQRNPVAVADTYSLNQNTPLNVSVAQGVLANDSDPDGDTITAAVVANPTNGTVTLNANGSFVYTPTSTFVGTDTFTYRASDGVRTSAVTTVTLTVNNVNEAPVGVANTYTVTENGTLTVDATAGVLTNDTDPDNNPLTATLVTNVTRGTLTLNSNGSFVYTPNAGFSGTDTFTYRASDGTLTSSPTTVTINVTNVNVAPVAVANNYTAVRNTALNVAVGQGVLVNDTDGDGDTLTATLVTNVTNGTLTLNSNGSFVYTPTTGFTGTDTFTYRATDGLLTSSPATVTITVANTNAAPVAVADTYSVAEDAVLTVAVGQGVLVNDTDAEGNTLTAAVVTNPTNGTLTLNPTGSFVYTPAANFSGTDTFQYRANDGTTSSASVTVTINVTAVNDAPVANSNTYSVNRNATLTTTTANGVLLNDTDAEGSTLTATLVTNVTNGTLTLNSNGSFVYTPTTGFTGTDTFTYRASDGTLTSSPATVTITVANANTAPVAVADTYSVAEDAVLTIAVGQGVLVNDTDAEGNTLTAAMVTNPTNGTLTLNANGSFVYTPAANFSGTDTFQYRANDGTNNSAAVTVTLTVTAINDAPVASNNNYTATKDTTLTTTAANGVLSNDTDPDGTSLTAALVTNVTNGTLTLNSNGSFVYTPTTGFTGTDTFTYRASDGTLTSATATVTITVANANAAPVAVADTYSVAEDAVLTVAVGQGVLVNDTDAEGNTLTAAVVTNPTNGTLTLNANGSFVYTPAANFSGTDTFQYRANDGTSNSAAVTVTVTVTAVNDAPVASNNSYTVDEDTTLTTTAANGVLSNDTDADGNTLVAGIVAQPTHGTVTFNVNGSFVYVPAANFAGTDTFTYMAGDGTVDSNVATVTITVSPVNDAPTATNDNYASAGNVQLIRTAANGVLANDQDVDGNTLTAVLVTNVTQGTLALNADGSFTYSPPTGFSGTQSFTYRASDGTLTSSIATVVMQINATPVTVADAYTVAEDGTLNVAVAAGVLANDTDSNGDTLTAEIVTNPTHGQLTLNANGSFVYTPTANYSGTDAFTYTATDGFVDSPTTTVTITITPVADSPIALDDAYSMAGGQTLTVNVANGVLANDSDPDGVTLIAQLVVSPANGNVTLNSDGSFTYTPNTAFRGTDQFVYIANDGTVNSSAATVAILVNTAPVAANDAYSVVEDATLNIDLVTGILANDTDADSDPIVPSLVSNVQHGTLTLNANGSFTYVPAANYHGADSFTYKLTDGVLDSATATVAITVTPVNDRPVAVGDDYQVNFGTTLVVNAAQGVLVNDTDPDGDTLRMLVVVDPQHGDLTWDDDGSFTYVPDSGYSGTDTFTYTADDGELVSNNIASVTVTVRPENSFQVAASAAAGAVVGTVVPDANVGATRLFEIDVPSLDNRLQLRPDDHLTGSLAARLVLVEYLDLQCPSCQAFHPLVNNLETQFPNDLLIVRRHFPLTSIHPNALSAALSAEAAGMQGKFDEMADLMYEHQDEWETVLNPQSFFDTYAQQLNLNLTQFATDRVASSVAARVNRDLADANALSAPGTPTFYLNGTQLNLSSAFSNFSSLINAALADFDDPFIIDRGTGQIRVANTAALASASGTTISLTVNVTDLTGTVAPETVTIQVGPANAPQAALSASAVARPRLRTPQVLTSDIRVVDSVSPWTVRRARDLAMASLARRASVAADYSAAIQPEANYVDSVDSLFESLDGAINW